MAMKTVICLSFIVLNNFFWKHVSGPLLGGGEAKGGGAPLNNPQKNCPAYPPKLLLPLQQFQDGGFFFGNQPRPQRKVDHIGAMTFFFGKQQTTW